MRDNIVDKNDIKKFKNMKKVFEKSIALKSDFKKGHRLKFNDLLYLKPGTGIKPQNYKSIIGMKLKRNLKKNYFIRLKDLSE